MHRFAPGQRWVNNAELKLGLGQVMSVAQRTIEILFPATGETRTYNQQTAPLTRVMFGPGDVIHDQDSRRIRVEAVQESGEGLLLYSGKDDAGTRVDLPETRLDHLLQLNRPKDRLLAGLVDDNKWYALRYQTLHELHRLGQSELDGLTGCRTDLIPHQLYIAHEVGKRHAPRVLLADEVGLGKTIEAGLIMHRQLYAERIRRVLVVVPENLLHQWLVEMLRRFNLRFSLFDEERYHAARESGADRNPFQDEQLVLCPLHLVSGNREYYRHVLEAGWDMLVVDEAHHLYWEPGSPGPGYRAIEGLAAATHGVLLLTATPEQLGKAGHYARLRLLDPARFPDYEAFLEEERGYEPVARAVEALIKGGEPETSALHTIAGLLDRDPATLGRQLRDDAGGRARHDVIGQLLDRHGTGRVLFRNTRAAIKGFPGRRHHPAPLSLPPEYAGLPGENTGDLQALLAPETAMPPDVAWTRIDPRFAWLKDMLAALKPEKVLVIAASARTAADLADVLRLKSGVAAAVFHEGMSIIERDRAAAWFADPEAGAQVLVCSEIGSEGRNFQFASHLVLFDLPPAPDLLEQRIGRLDRIGQKRVVTIHVPYLTGTAQEAMYRWYHEGLSAFERTSPAGQAVYERVKPALTSALRGGGTGMEGLLIETRALKQSLNKELEQGRDRLLEYNSSRPGEAERLTRAAREADARSSLPAYLERVFDCFGIHAEEHSRDSLVIAPEAGMVTALPLLPEDGMTVTWSREVALAHEDRQFLSWSHPLVIAAMDIVLGQELGNSAVGAISHPGFSPGMLLLEANYLLESATAGNPGGREELPPTLVRVLAGEDGTDHAGTLPAEAIEHALTPVGRDTAGQVVALKQDAIKLLVESCNRLAAARAPRALAGVRGETLALLAGELSRLEALARVNPSVRAGEIDWFRARLARAEAAFDAVTPRLDGVRLLVTT